MSGFFETLAKSGLLQRAVVAGALSGFCCASLSPLVVLKRMAFIGDGMAHAAFGGIGLALFVLSGSRFDDWSVQLFTLVFCLIVGLAVGRASRRAERSALSEDSAIGIAFSVSMALGALLIKLRQSGSNPQYVPPLDNYLFGNLINIGEREIWMLVLLAGAVAGAMLLFRKEIFFYAFDARLAEISGINVGLIHYVFMILLVLTVVVSARVVGIVLVSASMVLPGVIALKLCSRLGPAVILSGLVGMVSFEAGLYGSYKLSVHSGSCVVLIQFLIYILSSLYRKGQIAS